MYLGCLAGLLCGLGLGLLCGQSLGSQRGLPGRRDRSRRMRAYGGPSGLRAAEAAGPICAGRVHQSGARAEGMGAVRNRDSFRRNPFNSHTTTTPKPRSGQDSQGIG